MIKGIEVKAKILKLLGSKKPVNFDIKNAKKILFFRYDRIGDMIITTPVFRELKLAYPHINLTILASKVNRNVLSNNPYIDHVILNHKNNFFGDILSLLKLRYNKYDVCIEFDHSVIPHAILRLKIINPKKVISIIKEGRYGVNGNELSIYDIYTKKPKKEHFRNIWLGILEPFGVKPRSNRYDLFITDKQKKRAQNFIKEYANKFLVGINLEGAVEGKRIRFSELFEICEGLYKYDNNIQVIILTSPVNFSIVSQKLKKMAMNNVVISYKTDKVLDAAALISKLDLIVTPDTSIVHIASTFNKPVVSIHENNQDSYELFSPTSKLNRTVFSKSRNSLNGYSLNLLLCYCFELINIIKKEDYE
jgi:ADP-heptose:LPS heptosyltransferase